ncbi:MAG: hypothetical protein ABI787_03295 [Spartobacteria bacterium]
MPSTIMKTLHLLALLTVLPLLSLHAADPAAASKAPARVAFAQYCFWTGEMELGQIEGVLRTEAGFIGGREVTLVDYDPARLSLVQLATAAKRARVADLVHLPAGTSASGPALAGVSIGSPLGRNYRAAPASDQKKQLEGTPYARLKLTPEEATKVNAFVRVDPARARASLGTASRAQLTAAQ